MHDYERFSAPTVPHWRDRLRQYWALVRGDRPTQLGHARPRRVLVVPRRHRIAHGLQQLRVALEIGEALAQVDRAVFGGQLRHHGEDGGADLG